MEDAAAAVACEGGQRGQLLRSVEAGRGGGCRGLWRWAEAAAAAVATLGAPEGLAGGGSAAAVGDVLEVRAGGEAGDPVLHARGELLVVALFDLLVGRLVAQALSVCLCV